MPRPTVPCEHCKPPAHYTNHVPGHIFVGWGHGWQPCPHCKGAEVVPDPRQYVFLISPVRGISELVRDRVRAYVLELEARGYVVHWPIRDTPQDDPIGMRICRDNALAIVDADEIHVWYEPTSVGSVFDLGMVFMHTLHRPWIRVVIANPDDVKPTDHKSFPNVLRALHERGQ